MNSILLLAFEYFKIGCVAIGGGYTTIPFLYYLIEKYSWFDVSEITQMIAVSNLTPGPIGINMATYAGIKVGMPYSIGTGLFGAILATSAFLLPSFIIIYFLAKFIKKHEQSWYIKSILYGLRPAAIGLLCISVWKILSVTVLHLNTYKESHNIQDVISLKSLLLLAVFFGLGLKLKKNPMILILIAIIIGILVRV